MFLRILNVEPDGTEGVAGGLFTGAGPVMVTDTGLDQLESVPLSSVALARTLNVFVDPEATVQVWDALAAVPELTRDVDRCGLHLPNRMCT